MSLPPNKGIDSPINYQITNKLLYYKQLKTY